MGKCPNCSGSKISGSDSGGLSTDLFMRLWDLVQDQQAVDVDKRIVELEARVERLIRLGAADEKRAYAAEAKLARVWDAITPNGKCECAYHAPDDRPCHWCYQMEDRIDAILADTGKPLAVVGTEIELVTSGHGQVDSCVRVWLDGVSPGTPVTVIVLEKKGGE
jgi:hypothetical protein